MTAPRTIIRTFALAVPVTAAVAAAPALAGTGTHEPVPKFSTGAAHVSGTTAQLTGRITPQGKPTSYVFEYGPTNTYGTKTKPVAVTPPVAPATSVTVTQTVTGFASGFNYRIVGTYTNGKGESVSIPGKNAVYVNKKLAQLHFVLGTKKETQVSTVYGGSAELAGSLQGTGSSSHALILQATPFPFTAPFTTLPGTILTSRTGSFVFQLARLTQSTEVRFATADPKPLISHTLLVQVTPKITLHVRRGGKTALFRLYGTVQPARTGAAVQIQQLLPQKAGSKHEGPRAHVVATTVLKHNNATSSRYSVIVKLSGNFRYRAFVRLPKGALASGHGSNVLIKAPKAKPKTKKKKHP